MKKENELRWNLPFGARGDPKAVLTREDVVNCYRTILRGDPEGEEIIERHLSTVGSVWDLVASVAFSDEFKTLIKNESSTRVDVIEAYKRILKREPESETAIEHHLAGGTTLWELISRLVESEEHKRRITNTSAMSLLKCINKEYLAKSFGERDRYVCLCYHYTYMNELMSQEAFRTALLDEFCFFRWDRPGGVHSVILHANRELDNEGELILDFQSGGGPIVSLSFSFVPGHVFRGIISDKTVILISRLQGKVGRFEDIRIATKDMGEISPQAILVAVLAGIALAAGIRAVAGVVGTNQLSFAESAAEAYERIYDGFFRSINARGPIEGFYHFELPLAERPLEPGHRGRKKLKREFKKQITMESMVMWSRTIAAGSGEPVCAPVDAIPGDDEPGKQAASI